MDQPTTKKATIWPRVIAIFIILISGILLGAWLTASFVYFPRTTITTQLQDLGLYGDFIGGTLGTLIALASLGVTIYLAIILHSIERENTLSAIQAQRRVAIMQMKFQEATLFKSQCDIDLNTLSNVSRDTKSIEDAYRSIERSLSRLTTMFPELVQNGEYFGFKIFIFSASRVSENSRMLFEASDSGISEEESDRIISETFTHLERAKKEYYETMKKLSEWAVK